MFVQPTVHSRIISVCAVLLLFSGILRAGTTGKVAGRVKDAKTSEPVIGTNVVLEKTSLGAVTDSEGYFVILNIPPGEHALRVSSIGYATVQIKVKVSADLTTTQNVDLTQQTVTMDMVVVTAQQPMIQVDRTNTQASIDAQQIKAYPVQDLNDILQLQGGVVRDAGGALHIRGGRSSEIAYMIDGVPVSDQFLPTGGSIVEVDKGNIQFLQVISGTFNAEYGQAQSGIINIISGEPRETYSGSVTAYSGSYHSADNIFLGLRTIRPLNETNIEASLSGPVPILPSLGFYVFGRYNLDDGYLFGKRLTTPPDAFPIATYRDWYRREFPNSPATINGAISIPSSLLTGDGSYVAMSPRRKISINAKLAYQLTSAIKTSYSLFIENDRGKVYDDAYRYNPDGLPNIEQKASTHIVTLNHLLDNNLFYVLNLSYITRSSNKFLYNDVIDPRYQTRSPSIDRFYLGGTELGKIFFETDKLLGKFDLSWQINQNNLIKVGVEATQHQLEYHELRPEILQQILPPPPTGLSFAEYLLIARQREPKLIFPTLTGTGKTGYNDLFYHHKPIEFALYAQDKVEINELILNLGIRFEYFNPDAVVLENPNVLPASGSVSLLSSSPARRAKAVSQVSPRLGVAFPISDRGVIHVSYGHFRKLPPFEYMYQNSEFKVAGSNDSRYTVGNAELKPQKTTAYEIGLQQQVAQDWGVDATLFYSDFRDLLGMEIIRQIGNVSSYLKRVNRDYGNNWGFTLAIKKRPTGLVSGTLDYTFMVGNGNESDPNNIAITRGATAGGFIRETEKQVLPLDWDQRHTLNGTLTIGEPTDWTLSFVGRFATGQPYTPEPILLDVNTKFRNTERKPMQMSIDMNASKSLQFGGVEGTFFVRVFNLFDVKNETRVHPTTGSAGSDYRFPTVVGYKQSQLVSLFTLSDVDIHQDWYAAPRRIQIGVSFNY